MKIQRINEFNEKETTFKVSLNNYHLDVECMLTFNNESPYSFYSNGNLARKNELRNSLGGQIQNIIEDVVFDKYKDALNFTNVKFDDNDGNNYAHEHVFPSCMEVVCSFYDINPSTDIDVLNKLKNEIEKNIQIATSSSDAVAQVFLHIVKNGSQKAETNL